MAKGDDIQERLVGFAVRALDLCDRLPKSASSSHIVSQLIRSSSSAAPNYAEARGAESRNDLIHKLGIVFKELNESEVWLEMLVRRDTEGMEELRALREECSVLCRIIAASRKTAAATARIDTDRPKR